MAAAGGWVSATLNGPLPWMIGPLAVTTISALSGVPVRVSPKLRQVMISILGIILGSQFTPNIFNNIELWSISLIILVIYIGVSIIVGLIVLHNLLGIDRTTAYFTAAPGGLSEMVMMGQAAGGDDRLIALVHSLRIMLVVLVIPLVFRGLLGVGGTGNRSLGPELMAINPGDALLLALCPLALFPARWLRLPAPAMLGPMIASAGLHLTGLTAGRPPGVLAAAAMLVVGSAIGCRFVGAQPTLLVKSVKVALILSLVMALITLGFAALVSTLTGLPLTIVILAYAPGGFAEMSLLSLAMGMDPAFIATHHIIRIILIVVTVPPLFSFWRHTETS